MTKADKNLDRVTLTFSSEEAIILFEWLSRNWEKNKWADPEVFFDDAERQILIDIENELASILDEPFSKEYKSIVQLAYKKVALKS